MGRRSDRFQLAVVVAMPVMRMVQMTVDQIIDVIAVRDRFMAAVRTVPVIGVVTVTEMAIVAIVRVRFRNLNPVFVIVVAMRAVHVAVVQVVDMVAVLDRRMPATRAVPVVRVFVRVVIVLVFAHRFSPRNRFVDIQVHYRRSGRAYSPRPA